MTAHSLTRNNALGFSKEQGHETDRELHLKEKDVHTSADDPFEWRKD